MLLFLDFFIFGFVWKYLEIFDRDGHNLGTQKIFN